MPAVDLVAVVTRLHRNARAVDELLRGLDAATARWRARPESWSLLEVVNHLADEEVEDFRARVRSTLEDPSAPWAPIDPAGWVTARAYNAREPAESLDRFLTERQASLDWLGNLSSPDWDRTAQHPTLGPLRAGDLLAAWLAHDQAHIAQLARLLRSAIPVQLAPYSIDYAG
jgi:hypothetical protein